MFLYRLSKQQETHQLLFESSGYGDSSEIVAFAQCPTLSSVVRLHSVVTALLGSPSISLPRNGIYR